MTDKHKDISEYTLSSPPPKDHPDLGKWVWGLFEDSFAEKERLGLMERWKSNYRLFRGNHWGNKARGNKDRISINLFFANVQRTVANITAKNPVAEVIDLDGADDQADQVLSMKMKKWWNETEQQALLCKSSQNNEIYGRTIEKAVWDPDNKQFVPVVLDSYSYFPAPGYYSNHCDVPYEIHAFAVPIHQIENTFGVADIQAENVRSILGIEDRENVRPNMILADSGVGVTMQQRKDTDLISGTDKGAYALVIECWLHDSSEDYPDGVRVITTCNRDIFLNDMPNPNINLEMNPEQIKHTYAWGRKPFYDVNSYEDSTSNWGFSAAEQTGDLNRKIDEIVSRMANYVNRALYPPLIVEKGCGISRSMINNKPSLVLMPTRPNARIEFLPVPNLPSNFFQVLDLFINLHDRIYQIEDADRGQAPAGVIAASAIATLQERNAVLIRHKIRATEYLCRERGRWNISFLQNFSVKIEQIQVGDDIHQFQGVALAGRRFNYVVESDSTIARTSVQDQEQAVGLFKLNAIDRTALLETLNFKDRKQIIERMGETQLDQAFQILIQAGLPEEMALQLKQQLLQPQTGPQAQEGQVMSQPSPGVPRAQQGAA
ncbi:hypothetical protein [Desulfobacter postgatei]|uniref:hypothetical protein n=1 Tax=Desulfobacter postgatei TaxID=2293 RepID=UPI00259B9033|nr:hypothetical protein [uncultured Desulfobacter sp.]